MEKNRIRSVKTGKSMRMSYQRQEEVLEMPNLIEVQRDSYKWFLDEGLREVFDDISPIADYSGKLSLEFIDFTFDEKDAKYTIEQCKERDATYAAPLKVRVRLINKETEEINEHEIFMGDLPIMTVTGTFVINGAERVIVSQLVRSPGIYYAIAHDKLGKRLFSSTVIPNRGAWLEYETDSNDVFYVRVDRTRKVPITVLIRALGVGSNAEIIDLFGEEPKILASFTKDTSTNYQEGLLELYKKIRPGEPLAVESAESLINAMFFDPRRYDLAKVGRYKFNKKLHLNRRIVGHRLAEDVVDASTGEILAEEGTVVTKEMANTIQNSAVPYVWILGEEDRRIKVLSNLMVDIRHYLPEIEDPKSIGITESVYYPVLENILEENDTLEDRIAAIHRDIHDLIPKHITREDIFASINYNMHLEYGLGNADDIDHLGNRRIRAVGELLQNQYRIGLSRLERVVRERMTTQDTENISPQSLINIKPVTAAVKEFFGSSQLSQFMDQNNPLGELTHKRRLSALGPGGLSRDRAGFEVRDVHYSHYGRMCPVETPEGPNIGLINSLASYARINQYGFIEAPYRKIDKSDPKNPRVTDEVVYMTADEEDNYHVAQANEPLDEEGYFIHKNVSGRFREETQEYERHMFDYMDVSPRMVFSVATALIPFLQNDDANRALMGSNMQRQAVPLLTTEAPVVGTGMEVKTAVDSGVCVVAKKSGTVLRSTSTDISIKNDDGTTNPHPPQPHPHTTHPPPHPQPPQPTPPPPTTPPHHNPHHPHHPTTPPNHPPHQSHQPHTPTPTQHQPQPPTTQHTTTPTPPKHPHPNPTNPPPPTTPNPTPQQPPPTPTNHTPPPNPHPPHPHNHPPPTHTQHPTTPHTQPPPPQHHPPHPTTQTTPQPPPTNTPQPHPTTTTPPTPPNPPHPTPPHQHTTPPPTTQHHPTPTTPHPPPPTTQPPTQPHQPTTPHTPQTPPPPNQKTHTNTPPKDDYHLTKYLRSNQSNCYNQKPIVFQGEHVEAGQVIADGPSTANGELALGKNPLIGFMTWEGYNYEDAVLLSERLVMDDVYTSVHIEEYECEARDTKLGPEEITRDVPGVGDDALKDLDERGIIRIGAEVRAGDILVGKVTPKGETELTAEERLLRAIFGEKAREVRDTSLKVPHGEYGIIVDAKVFTRENGDEMSPGVNQSVRIYIAQKRKISVGDKMAGRHGNKGVVSRVLPVEDMPFLPNGRPLDIVLNPLGVPSRMNIGQVLEIHLSLAAKALGFNVATPIFQGANEHDIQDTLELANDYVNTEDFEEFREKYKDILAPDVMQYLDENKAHRALWKGVPISRDGKVRLRDGRTGEYFDSPVTIGHMHYLKLHHLVDDKIHARSTGPYSLVTQQPLGGKAQFGGQRFGEMEVWALEAYGASYTLQEILTVKSDDVVGRVKTYEAIIKGDNIPEPGIPESFKVLLKELQSLGLDVKVLKDDNTEVHLLESVDYGDTDLRSVIEGDSRRHHDREEDYGKHGYTKQEFDGEELVDIDEDEDEDDFIELDEALEDNDEE